MKQLIIMILSMFLMSACGDLTGRAGNDGSNGTNGSNGLKGDKGDSGATGAKGSKGDTGSQGIQGVQGVQGPSGSDATPVTVVKFCKEDAVYPSVFPEYGICLQGQVYGVYSANGGFLSLLPEGAYGSNAIGSACDFKIGPKCEIIH